MKTINKIILIWVIIGLLQPVFAQNIKLEYQVKAKQSLTRPAFTEPFWLLINKNSKSLFISKNKIIANKILKKYYDKKLKIAKSSHVVATSATDPEMIEAKKYKNKYKIVIEKDFKSHKYRYQQNAFMSVLQYRSDLPKLKWQLKDSVKKILGYTVYKAILDYKGRHYTAWYAPAIAVSDGPYKFCGLPGLILEIYDNKDDYHFTATGIEFPEKIVFPKKYFMKNSTFFPVIQTTEKNFLKDFDKTFNPDNVLGTTAYIGKNIEEMKEARVQKIKSKYNNPIELTDD